MESAGSLIARVRESLLESAEVKCQTATACGHAIAEAAFLIANVFRFGGKVLLCGNGGSAADCQHMAAEFVSRFRKEVERPGLPALALTTDTSFLTAYANDCGYEGVFARQVETLGCPGDLLIAISTSGSSKNVLLALQAAATKQMRTIALTGIAGILGNQAEVAIAIPSADTQRIQEAHLAVEHVLCDLVETMLFPEKTKLVELDSCVSGVEQKPL
jgi:D-sedoheptulose 7-phosphate isomerase